MFPRSLVAPLAAAAFFALALPALAAPNQMVITKAFHDTLTDELTIEGVNFGTDEPDVTLAGVPLDVLSHSDTLLEADVTGFTTGVHALVVSNGNVPTRTARLEVTLGVVGPVGATGPQGNPSNRFKDNGNGTVTDGPTGLIWLKDWGCGGLKTWVDGIAWAAALADGQCGLTDGSSAGDWRMPTIEDWLDRSTPRQDDSMVKLSCRAPSIPDTAGTGCWTAGNPFTNVMSVGYWSATPSASSPSGAWEVGLGNVRDDNGPNLSQVVAVRGGR